MTQRADLHLHTAVSDGMLTPSDVVRKAAALAINVLSVTDHDTIAGIPEAVSAGQAAGVTVIPGVELSCEGDEEVHLLRYGYAGGAVAIQDFLDEMIRERRVRMAAMLEKAAALGIAIPPGEVRTGGGPFVGRVHLARALVGAGAASSVRQAFSKYL